MARLTTAQCNLEHNKKQVLMITRIRETVRNGEQYSGRTLHTASDVISWLPTDRTVKFFQSGAGLVGGQAADQLITFYQ